jgi:phosphate transport system substrate-binding protein
VSLRGEIMNERTARMMTRRRGARPCGRPLSIALAATVFVCTILAAGCGSASSSAASSVGSSASTIAMGAAGSTFVEPIMAHWIGEYQKTHPGVQVNYRAIGSGAGIEELKKGFTEFAASDAPLDDDQLKGMTPVIQVPATAGPVCVIYNLPQLDHPLRLSAKTLAGIFLGDIISWQDPAIVKDNPGLRLPRAAVIVVHRADGSGTTSILTSYLSTVSKEWSRKSGHGLSVTWPTGLAAEGSKGILNLVKQAPGTIGYLELNYAKENSLSVASIQNQAGEFVAPTPGATAAAIEAFRAALAKDIRTPIVDPPASAKSAYSIAGLSFVLIPKERADEAQQRAVRDFVAYAISTGQESAEGLSYAQLPDSLREQGRQLLSQLGANGQSLK